MQISRSIIAAILATNHPHLRKDAARVAFTVICTVEEGVGCRFAQAGPADHTVDGFALAMVDWLGWKAVEYSARRQVILRCTVPAGDPQQAECTCDRGDGFIPVEVVD